jgi:hypothetical protein
VAVSRERGLLHITIKEEITNQDRFLPFIMELSRHMNWKPFYLFMDKLSVHKAINVKEKLKRYDITPIYNVTASPEYNPIETVFAHVKAQYRRARLNALANTQDFDLDVETRNAFNVVTTDLVIACFKRSYYLLKND